MIGDGHDDVDDDGDDTEIAPLLMISKIMSAVMEMKTESMMMMMMVMMMKMMLMVIAPTRSMV